MKEARRMGGRPHVLLIPSWYPTVFDRVSGRFFLDQARALRRAGVKIGAIYPEIRNWRTARPDTFYKSRFQTSETVEHGIPTVRFHGWNLPRFNVAGRLLKKLYGVAWHTPRLKVGSSIWVRIAQGLIDRYVRIYGKPDLLHAHSVFWGGVAAAQAAKRHGVPYVVTEHSSAFPLGLISPWQKGIAREVFLRAAGIYAVSVYMRNSILPYARGRRIQVVPNPVDTGYFMLPAVPRGISPYRILTVAILTPNKGVDVLLRAFRALLRRVPGCRLEIGGNGPAGRELERLAESLGVANRVRFLGMLSRAGVRRAMWRANLFVLPSYVETFGVVLAEAMGTGLPVVATRSGGPEDFVRLPAGRLVMPGDPSRLAAALAACHAARRSQERRARMIRSFVTRRFSGRAIARSLLAEYCRVLQTSPGESFGR